MGFVLLGLIIGVPLLLVGISAIWDLRHRRATGQNTTITRRSRRAGFTYSPGKSVVMDSARRSGAKRRNYGDIGHR